MCVKQIHQQLKGLTADLYGQIEHQSLDTDRLLLWQTTLEDNRRAFLQKSLYDCW